MLLLFKKNNFDAFQQKFVGMNILFILTTLLREVDLLTAGTRNRHGRLNHLQGGVATIVLNSTHRAFTEDPVAQVPNPHPLAVTITIE